MFEANGIMIENPHYDEMGINEVDPIQYYGYDLANHLVNKAKQSGFSFYYDKDRSVLVRLVLKLDKLINGPELRYGIVGHCVELYKA